MSAHPELIQQFCKQAIANGVLDSVFRQARTDLLADWEDCEDTLKRDQLWHTLRALQKIYGIMQGYSHAAPEVDDYT